ncbi:MAG: lactonase family protein [Gemmataceae bacterium]
MTRLALLAVAVSAVGVAARLTAAPPPGPPAEKYWVFLGTYTGGPGGSKGIYRCELDAATGRLSEPELAAEVTSPSFLTFRPDGKVLYAVGETGGKDGGGVFAYTVDAASGKLTKLAEATSGGPGPCHVVTDPSGRLLLVANYGGGSWKLFYLNPDGKFGSTIFNPLAGTGPNKQRQEKPHAHCGAFHPAGGKFFVADLGTDKVWAYRVSLTEVNEPGRQGYQLGTGDNLDPLVLPPGAGPRHLVMSAAGDRMFVCGELDSTLNVFAFTDQGTNKLLQSISTLPDGKPVPGNSTAEVRIHPNGRFVYVSNRGHNSIAAFRWDGAKLTPVGHATEGIKTPRNFNLDPTGKWMLVANQDGDSVVVFAVDPETGLPKPTGNSVTVGRPVCVKFLAKP